MKFYLLLIVIIVLFGGFLRVYKINEIPLSLNVDEAALGYNAFSIWKTGADEHGTFIPLSLKSFGDWKLPVYSYIDAPFIGLLEPSKLAVRLPSILAGTASILLIYFISLKLFKNRKVALISGLFLAINPWSVFFSRGAYEVNVGLTFFLGGLTLLLAFLEDKRFYTIFLSFLFFGITLFSHHTFIVFTPLFVLTTLVLLRKDYKKNLGLYLALLFFGFIILSSLITLSFGGSRKTSNLNVFNDEATIYRRADKLRGDGSSQNLFIEKSLYNKYYAGTYQFVQNYFKSYSPEFLFDKGGEKLVHNLGDTGYFYLTDCLFFALGLFFLLWKREKKALIFIISWMILVPIPSAFTREISGTRLYQMTPLIALVSSYGVYYLLILSKKRSSKIVLGTILSFVVLISFIYFCNYYFIHFNTQRIRFWNYGFEEMAKVADKYPEHNIVVRGPENFPYVYFLLYNKYHPDDFRSEAEYFPENKEGFLYVKKFGRYSFVPKLQGINEEQNTIYFDDQNFNDGDNLIKLPNGDPVLKYYFGKSSN